jgi:dTDP-4-dehydrorhamnose 3,5-epimerase
MLSEARRAPQTVTSDWVPVKKQTVEGVQIIEIKNIAVRSGLLTECYRPEWFHPRLEAAHVVHMALMPGGLSSWHCHHEQNDAIIAVRGQLRIGLYDDRPESPTYKLFELLHVSIARPTIIHVPPLVWHAIKNPTGEEAAYVVINNLVYDYALPDDWTLPPGSTAIPHTLD